MTNKDAIQFLDNIKHEEAGRAIGKDGFYAELMGYHVEALNMAIKALETIPKYKNAYNKGYADGVKATNVDCGVVWEERIDAIKTDIDKQIEIHSDGEFYIKNIDVKRIIDKHCGGENE